MVGLLRGIFGFFLGLPLVLLLVCIIACYHWRWDEVAAITVFPFWVWPLGGLFLGATLWLFFQSRVFPFFCLLCLASLFYFSDERPSLLRGIKTPRLAPAPAPKIINGRQVYRVVTANTQTESVEAAEDLQAYAPDLILVQEHSPMRHPMKQLAGKLYGKNGFCIQKGFCAILGRGKILKVDSNFNDRYLLAIIQLPSGKRLSAISLHLESAKTSWNLLRRQTWKEHRHNRQERRSQLQRILARLALHSHNLPAILGGDFNAPAGDVIFRELENKFTDAWKKAGVGLGNTYENQLPLLRIDHLFATNQLTPYRASTIKSTNSDHRFLICDFLWE